VVEGLDLGGCGVLSALDHADTWHFAPPAGF
jgi:hypothetical protein